MIRNPILPGFHPDPSIERVGEDYYLATSTFEWLPGIRLHHSRDLVHWRPIGHALTRPSQIDLRGAEASTGVWAPCLTWVAEEGLFYLAYTVMRSWSAGYFDLDNLLVTAPTIEGPWSDPVYLNSSGFDPSFFHEAGRHWVVNLEWETRPGHEHPGPLVLQEYDATERALVGQPQRISNGTTDLGCLEGPRLFQRGDWYYLMTAEGGTGFGHAVALGRSRQLTGPWEPSPCNPLLSAGLDPHLNRRGVDDFLKPYQDNPSLPLQKVGHGCLVETSVGEWYLAHLCARPLGPDRRSTLGRETALQKVRWTSEGWLELEAGGSRPQLVVTAPALPSYPFSVAPPSDDFDRVDLGPVYQTLRGFADPSWLSLTERSSFLRLRGRQTLASLGETSLVTRRVQAFDVRVETRVEASPTNYRQAAGLVWYYDQQMWFALRVTWDEDQGRPSLGVVTMENGVRREPGPTLDPSDWAVVHLRAVVQRGVLGFSASPDGKAWTPVGPDLDATLCSDEASAAGHFTGTMVGLFCWDQQDRSLIADFDYFTYEEGIV